MSTCWAAMALGAVLLLGTVTWAEGDGRRVKTKVPPAYPELARQMRIAGTVRLEVVVAANGSVKSIRALGGHPVLIQAANEAIRKWRYEPGAETTTVVEFRFHD